MTYKNITRLFFVFALVFHVFSVSAQRRILHWETLQTTTDTTLNLWLQEAAYINAVSYTHLRAHETPEHLVCRLLLEKKTRQSQHY